jgi:DNA-binding transcriptional LysR family regulator
MNLDMNQLRAFVAVAEHKSFSKASKKLCRVQSAVSQQIQKLESRLDTELFLRSKKGLQLTADGDSMLPYAIKILNLNDKAVSQLTKSKPKSRIRVGTSDSYASSFFADILKVCVARFSELEIEVHCGYSNKIWSLYEEGELDLVLTQGCPSGVTSELLFCEPLRWVRARGSNVFIKNPIPLALFTKGCGDRNVVVDSLNRAGRNYWIGYHSTSHSGVIAAISSGLYVSAILLSTVDDDFRVLEASEGFPALGSLEVSLAYRDHSVDAPMNIFADIIRSYFSSPNGGRSVIPNGASAIA